MTAGRVLILDRDPGGPRLLLATIAAPSDVRPAPDASGPYGDWPAVRAWVASRLGGGLSVAPVTGALAWHIHEGRTR